MAINDPTLYGRDVRCQSDADDLFTDCVGIDVVKQDALHLITQTDFLGPGGDARGFDLRSLIGKDTRELANYAPIVSNVLTEGDDRILSAAVTLKATTRNGLADVEFSIACETAQGPFDLTRSVLDLTEAILEGQSV